MDRLTLSQAQAALARLLPDVRIDWQNPSQAARDAEVLWRSTGIRIARSDLDEALAALDAYARHVEFQAGCQFAETAIRRALNDAITSEPTEAGRAALRAFESHIADGLHLAEPEKPTPQMGDVWRIGNMVASDAVVRCAHPETGNLTVSALHGKDRSHKVIGAEKFVADRRLVERDGKAV